VEKLAGAANLMTFLSTVLAALLDRPQPSRPRLWRAARGFLRMRWPADSCEVHSVLDIGCGDGTIGSLLMSGGPILAIEAWK